jgi:hypothetical protein
MNDIDHLEPSDRTLDAIFHDLHGGVSRHVRSPGTAMVRRTVRRRQVTRRVAAAVAAVAVLAGVATAAVAVKRAPDDGLRPADPPSPTATHASPSPTPSPTASPNPSGGIRDVPWTSATLDLPKLGACPARTVTFKDGVAGAGSGSGDPRWTINTPRFPGGFAGPVYADLDRDGATDALIRINCQIGYPSEYSVVGVALGAGGRLRVLGEVVSAAPDAGEDLTSARVSKGVVTVVITARDPRTQEPRSYSRRLRWAGSAFTRVDTENRIADLNWRRITLNVPAMPGCPARRVTLGSDTSPTTDPGWDLTFPGAGPTIGDLTGDGQAEALAVIQCLTKNPATGGVGFASFTVVAIALDENGKPYTLGSMTALARTKNLSVEHAAISGRVARIVLEPIGDATGGRTEKYRWNGSRFVRIS